MKALIFVIFLFFYSALSAQVLDTVLMVKEVDSLLQESRKLIDQQKFDVAIQLIKKAEIQAELVLGENSKLYATCIFNHGRTYSYMGKYDEAFPLYIKAMEIRERVLGIEHPEYAESLVSLANLNLRKGNYLDAELLYLKAKELLEKSLGKEHPTYVNTLNGLAVLNYFRGDYSKAEPIYKEIKEIRLKTLGANHPDYAKSLLNLGLNYKSKSDYAIAEQLYLETKEILLKTLGAEHPDYATCLGVLSSLYWSLGDFAKAEQLSLESKVIIEKKLGKEHPDYAKSLINLAFVYRSKGDYRKAELLYLEAKNILEKVVGKGHPDYALVLNDLAVLYYYEDDYIQGERLYLEALKIRAKTIGKEHPDYAWSLNDLACLYADDEQYNKAEPLFLEAKKIRAKILGMEHPDYAVILNNLALLYREIQEYRKGELLDLEAKEIWKKFLGKENKEYALTLLNLALIYRATNRISESTSSFLEANDLILGLVKNSATYSSESQMLAYVKIFNNSLDQLYSFTQSYPITNCSQACFNNALFYKGFLLDNLNKLILSANAADSLTRENFILWQGCRRRLASEFTKPITERKHINEVENEAVSLEKLLLGTLPILKEIHQILHWNDIRDVLPYNSAAVEFISYRYYTPKPTDSTMYAALVLLPKDTTPHFIPLFEERQLQDLLNRPGLSEKLVLKDLYGNSPELRRLIWDPLEPLMRDVKTIYYSPSGLLHRINPGAILDESNQPLSEGRNWVRVGSTRELVTGRLADRSFALSPEANSNSTLTAMVYGGITYDMDSLAFARANPIGAIDSTEIPRRKGGAFSYIISEQPDGSGTRGNPDGTWSTLSATSKEADEVGAMLAGAGFSTQKRQGFYASEEQFKQVGVNTPSPRVLHLATHGFSYPDPKKTSHKGFSGSEPTYKMLDDPMLRSGLVLAGANYYWKNKRPLTNREDGVLVAYEVRDLNLRNTELAVLSACQTGLGDVVGSEGVYGLQRAFRIAGAKFLIVSLWQVPDEQTQELMRIFYQNWLDKKESLRDAFNHAQQALREKEPNPYMWAGFVLIE